VKGADAPTGPRRPRLPIAGGGRGFRDGVGRTAGRAIGLRGCRGAEVLALDMGELYSPNLALDHLANCIRLPGIGSLAVMSAHSCVAQCRVPPFPGPLAFTETASTDKVNVRCSFAFIAPTPMSLRVISWP
jgi:hypothetical protein